MTYIGEDATRGEGGGGGRGGPDPGGRCTRTPDPGSGHTPPRGWQGELGVWTRMDGGAQNIDAESDPGGGGGGGPTKNVYPPWQNPRYAPATPPLMLRIYGSSFFSV